MRRIVVAGSEISPRISSSLFGDSLAACGGAAVTALASQVTIPAVPVPITLQTLAVMLCGLTLGARRGALSQMAYLAAGAAGAPVFAEWTGGVAHLYGLTGGYLFGFVLLASLVGFGRDKGYSKPIICFLITLAASMLQLLAGTAWLAQFIGFKQAWQNGFVPFVLLEMVKVLFAVSMLTLFRLRPWTTAKP